MSTGTVLLFDNFFESYILQSIVKGVIGDTPTNVRISNMKVSVITTCFNAEKHIEKTIKSVLCQDYRDFEYIIMDGASGDSTVRIAESYKTDFANKGIPYHIFSEKDHGIYEGMNHGFAHSLGDYINFLNADDEYVSEHVLSDIFAEGNTDADIIYGDAIGIEFGKRYRHTKDISLIENKMPFSHQSVFAKRECLIKFPLNTAYKIAADYDFLLSAYKEGLTFFDSGVTVCLVTLDGLSSIDLYSTFIETVDVQVNHGIKHFSESEYRKKLKEYKIKQAVMNHFPKCLIAAIRKLQRISRSQNEEL